MSVRIIQGDCREALKALPDASVQMCVTSPPYFGLRDYGTASWDGGDAACDHLGPPMRTNNKPVDSTATFHGGAQRANEFFGKECGKCGAVRIDQQIGLESSVDAYVAEMVAVFREVRRVLRKDGTLLLNLGDSYMGGGPHHGEKNVGKSGTNKGSATGRDRYADAPRAAAYGTPDTALADSPIHDCLCGSLCDACRVAYQIGKAHSDGRPAPMPSASPSATNRGNTGSASDHLPTSDSENQADRSSTAIEDSSRSPDHADAPLLASRASTPGESSRQQLGYSRPLSTPSACLLCSRSISVESQASERRMACPCAAQTASVSRFGHHASTGDNGEIDGSSGSRIAGMASDLAYPHFTIPSRLKPKDLIGVPWRVAFALQADGWYLRSDIIWAKPNPMPESCRDRPTKSHEYIFLFSKAPRYYWDQEAVKEESEMRPQNRNTNGRGDKDIGYAPHRKAPGMTEPNGRNIRSVWTIATTPFPNSHFATFPPALAERCIKAGTSENGCCGACGAPYVRVLQEGERVQTGNGRGANATVNPNRHPGEEGVVAFYVREKQTTGWQPTCTCDAGDPVPCVVLDPFAGAGTVGLVADRLGRDAILIELNQSYVTMSAERIRRDSPMFAAVQVDGTPTRAPAGEDGGRAVV